MLTEHEVRLRMESIRASRVAPLRKARLLLKLGSSLGRQAKKIDQEHDSAQRANDVKGAAVLLRIAKRSQALRDDVRDAAHQALTMG